MKVQNQLWVKVTRTKSKVFFPTLEIHKKTPNRRGDSTYKTYLLTLFNQKDELLSQTNYSTGPDKIGTHNTTLLRLFSGSRIYTDELIHLFSASKRHTKQMN